MKNDILKQAFALIAIGAMMCGCSSDSIDENTEGSKFESVSERPDWYVDLTGNITAAPDWTEPAENDYQHNMLVCVTLEESLKRFSTNDDLMAAFVNGECREVCPRSIGADGKNIYFLMNIRGYGDDYSDSEEVSETEENVELRYYSGGGKELFSSKETFPFIRGDYNLDDFTAFLSVYGNKYTVNTNLDITLPKGLPFNQNTDDMLGFFVGNECRGVLELGSFLGNPHYYTTLYGRTEGESVVVKYYSGEKKGVYTINSTITTNKNDITNINITF